MFSSTDGIKNHYLGALGAYKKSYCNSSETIVYYNEESGFYLLKNLSHASSLLVRSYIIIVNCRVIIEWIAYYHNKDNVTFLSLDRQFK